jgi:hypothetical protein
VKLHAKAQGKVEGEKRSGILMRSRKERQNSDRPSGRRGSGSKKSGPGPGPIHRAPTGNTQDRAGRGNEKETGARGTGALRYRQMFIQSVPGGPLGVCGTGKSEG